MTNHPNRSQNNKFFLYKTAKGRSGVVRFSEVIRVEERDSNADVLLIHLRDGEIIESSTFDLNGFASLILEDEGIVDML